MLTFPDCQMLDVTGPLQMFAGVNDELGRQAYELVIGAPKRGPFKTSSGIGLVANLAIADVSPAKCRASDTLIAAGGDRRGPSRSKLQQEVAELAAQRAAISEVLRAIASSPHDLEPIFQSIIDSAVRLCRGERGTFRRNYGSVR
jgi:transcriptional regulator GlxA family with amidase domain